MIGTMLVGRRAERYLPAYPVSGAQEPAQPAQPARQPGPIVLVMLEEPLKS